MNAGSSPAMMSTPFHLRTARLCLTNDWTETNGWTKVNTYSDSEAEYWALHNSVGVHDLTGLCQYRISGVEAVRLLDYVLTGHVRAMADGTAHHVLWCDDNGLLVSDGLLYRLNAQEFRLFSRQSSFLWLADAAADFEAAVEDVSHTVAGLAIQGPDARALLRAVGLVDVDTLPPMGLLEGQIQKVPILVGRVSAGGELGYELFVDVDDALFLWDELLNQKAVAAVPVGEAAVSVTTIEAGHPRLGIDFLSAETAIRPRRAVSPFELCWGDRVHRNKSHFVGRRALEAKRLFAPRQVLCGITYDAEDALGHCPIVAKGQDVGATVSVVWSPRLARHIGFAWVLQSALKAPHELRIVGHHGAELKVDHLEVPLQIVDRRFFRSQNYLDTPVAVA